MILSVSLTKSRKMNVSMIASISECYSETKWQCENEHDYELE